MDAIKEKAYQVSLYWNSRPSTARHVVKELGAERSDNLRVIEFDRVRVAAIQVETSLSPGIEPFVRQMFPLAKEAVERGAQLLVFPEHLGASLFGMLPGSEQLLESSMSQAVESFGEGVSVEDLFRFVGPAIVRAYRATFSELSRAFGVYIAAGSTAMLTRDGLRNVAHLYGPSGRLLGTTAKTHLLPVERRELGMGRGAELPIFDTRIGKVAMPVCMTASFFEPFRILGLRGAEIVALPIADIHDTGGEYLFWPALRGLWPRVQETPLFGIKACTVGRFLGMDFYGTSEILAPVELTPEKDGVLARFDQPDRQGVVVADVDLVALRKYREDTGFYESLNYDLYRRYLPWLYTQDEPPPEAWLFDREPVPHPEERWN